MLFLCCVSHKRARVCAWYVRACSVHMLHEDHPRACGENSAKEYIVPCCPGSPRVCGENFARSFSSRSPVGSPPRVRGKPSPVRPRPSLRGITPACAGKTTLSGKESRTRRDHPRACGENGTLSTIPGEIAGLPPRMRGKRIHGTLCTHGNGITPAHAGKTCNRKI